MYGPILSMIKLALFVLIYHIFNTYRWLRLLVYFGALANLTFYFSASISVIALCAPRDGLDHLAMARVRVDRTSSILPMILPRTHQAIILPVPHYKDQSS